MTHSTEKEKQFSRNSKTIFAAAFALALLFSALVLPAQFVSADGMGFIHDKDMWRGMSERAQYAAINYADGTQKMILLINADLAGEKAVWLFPVPAKPEDVSIDVMKGFPQLGGRNLEHEKPVANAFTLARLTQVYVLPLMAFYYLGVGSLGGAWAGSEVRVFEHVEKMGLTTELVTASDSNALTQYLNEKGLSLPSNARDVLGDYFGGDYSFVVSWISNVDEYKRQSGRGEYADALGVFVSFPTDKPFFPLKPTSFYGDARIPVNVYVTGFVKPELFDGVKSAKTTYFVQSRYEVPVELEEFFGESGAVNDLQYTKVEFNVPSRLFTQDLWFDAKPPAKIVLEYFVYQNSWLFVFLVIALSSCVASVAAALVVFRGSGPRLPRFALLGLANVFTILGFAAAASKLNVGESFVEKKVVPIPNAKGFKITKTALLWTVALALVLFSALFFVLFGQSFSYQNPASLLFFFVGLLALSFVAVMLLTIAWRAVFEPSSLTKNNHFVIVFSLAFLAVTLVFEFALNALIS